MTTRPEPLRTDRSNAFAHRTIRERLPAILDETLARNPDYPPAIRDALLALRAQLTENAPVPPLALPAPDHDHWRSVHEKFAGQRWQATQWFFAEVYFYRLFMQATRWWETGRDPFAPKKAEEYASEAHWELLERALATDGAREQSLATLLEYALRGNRIDLSYAVSAAHGSEIHAGDLLVDERAAQTRRLLEARGTAHIIADNAGSELSMDLALAEFLLTEDIASQLVLHLKWHPTFVSDAIVTDVHNFLSLARRRGGDARRLAERLGNLLEAGRLRLAPDPWWNSAAFLDALPPRLRAVFMGARLAILKGDANYRRMLRDTIWPAETPLRAIAGHFPCPLVALRTLKSDPVVGLEPGLAERLDTVDAQWRVNGKRAVLQGTMN